MLIQCESQVEEQRVVFFGGLYFKYRTLASVLPQQVSAFTFLSC
jgi:hypothetical protein